MTVITDVISHLDTNWGSVTPKPSFFNGHKRVNKLGTNYINIYNESTLYEDYDSAGLYKDETYTLLLEVGTTTNLVNMSSMVAEVESLLNTKFVTGYHYNKVLTSEIRDSSADWLTLVRIELKKLLQLKV